MIIERKMPVEAAQRTVIWVWMRIGDGMGEVIGRGRRQRVRGRRELPEFAAKLSEHREAVVTDDPLGPMGEWTMEGIVAAQLDQHLGSSLFLQMRIRLFSVQTA
jgi:hypothetical protein